MTVRRLVAVIWLVLALLGGWLAAGLSAPGDGRLADRVLPVIVIWLVALALAIGLGVATLRRPRPLGASERLLGYLPAIVSIAFWLVLGAAVVWFAVNFELGPGDDPAPAIPAAAPPPP